MRDYFKDQTPQMIELLRELMQIESPTHDKAAVDRMGARIREELEAMGAAVTVHPREGVGDIVVGYFNGDAPAKPIIFICHMDTVYPIGSLKHNPIREEEGLLYGPGSNDEKGGIVTMLTAIRGLQERGEMPDRPIITLMTTDEETGSADSRELIEEMAEGAALALIMEAAMPDGSLKTWRKSTGMFKVRTYGIASHSGGAHEAGLNAIEEMANQVIALQRMTRYKVGTTVSVGMINGGTARNVVPDYCEAVVDVRAMTADEMERLTRELHAISPVLPGARVEIEGEFDRPPMERNEVTLGTFEKARDIVAEYGLTIRESGTGGASDGNFTAYMGIPTLDGVGPIGSGAHSVNEHVIISSLSRSATLLAAVLKDWPIEAT